MHLSWGTSRQHIQCLRRATQVLEYLALALLTYAAPFATATGGLNSLPVEPTVYSCTCGYIYIYILRWHAHCTLHPTFSGYMRRHHQCPCTCACHCVHCASTSNVLRRARTGTNVLGASACSLCRTYCYRNRWLRFSPCRVHRLNFHVWWGTLRRRQQCYCTCACHGVHRAGTSSVLRRASTSTGVLRACVFSICGTFCNCNMEFHFSPCRAHRLHLHLWWSTLRRHHNGMLHRACLNVHRANWDARVQFLDSVVIFPMSR